MSLEGEGRGGKSMGSLDNLISFLLDEVALCGENGASRADVTRFARAYYAPHGHGNFSGAKGAGAVQEIDERFQTRVWKWLTKHPDIQVRATSIDSNNVGSFPNPSSASHFPGETSTSNSQQLRAYACQERMWYATAGHGPDPARIPPMDFTCLSVIAAHRERGILQPDLVKTTGQDKRSVPKRTQRLQDGGYIVKIPVASGSTRTSRLVLKKFIDPVSGQPIQREHATSSTLPRAENGETEQKIIHNKFSDAESLIRNAVGMIKEHGVIEFDLLKKKLGIWRERVPSRVLAVAVRRLENLGVVQRVKAPRPDCQPKEANRLYRSVKFIEEVTESRWRNLLELGGRNLQTNNSHEDDDGDANLDEHDEMEISNDAADKDSAHTALISSGTPEFPPYWDPDRLLIHILFDIVERSRTSGISLSDLKREAVGTLYRRPVEHTVSRLVEYWQISQPPHLQHLGIIRDAAQSGRTAFFIHYTHGHFKTIVDRGDGSWEDVRTMKNVGSPLRSERRRFPAVHPSMFFDPEDTVTLEESIRVTEIEQCVCSKIEPRLMDFYGASSAYGTSPRLENHNAASTKSKKQTGNLKKTQSNLSSPVRKGRPRKYPADGVPVNAGSISEEKLRLIQISQTRAKEYKRKKILKEIERRVGLGQPKVEAEEDVLVEFDVNREILSRQSKFATPKPPTSAHTQANPKGTELLSHTSSAKKRLYRSRKIRSAIGYFPSMLAHHPLPASSRVRSLSSKQTRRSTDSSECHAQTLRNDRPAPAVLPETSRDSLQNAEQSNLSNLRDDQLRPRMSPMSEHQDSTERDNSLALGFHGSTDELTADTHEQFFGTVTGLEPGQAVVSLKRSSLASENSNVEPPPKRRRTKKEPQQDPSAVHRNEQPPGTTAGSGPGQTVASLKRNNLTSEDPNIEPSAKRRRMQGRAATYETLASVDQVQAQPVQDLFRTAEDALNAPRPRGRPKTKSATHKRDRNTDTRGRDQVATRGNHCQTYDLQSQAILRQSDGVYIGALTALKAEPGTKRMGRPRKSRLVVFKSSRLKTLPSFAGDGQNSSLGRQVLLVETRSSQALPPYKGPEATDAQSSRASSHGEDNHASKSMPRDLTATEIMDVEAEAAPYDSMDSNAIHNKATNTNLRPAKRQKLTTSNVLAQTGPNNVAGAPNTSSPKENPVILGRGRQEGADSTSFIASNPTEQPFVRETDKRDTFTHADVVDATGNGEIRSDSQVRPNDAVGFVDSPGRRDELQIFDLQTCPTRNPQEDCGQSTNTNEAKSNHISVSSPGFSRSPEPKQPGLSLPAQGLGMHPKIASKRSSNSESSESGNTIALSTTDKAVDNDDVNIHDQRNSSIVRDKSVEVIKTTSPLNHIESSAPQVEDPAPKGASLSLKRPSSPRRKEKVGGITKILPFGGSTTKLRKNFVLDIVEACGGVFPGDKELWYPFATKWIRTKGAKPDQRTIVQTKKLLIDSGRLRQIRFSFRNKNGIVLEKTIVALGDAPSLESKVQELQEQIIAADPRMYIPSGVEVDPEIAPWHMEQGIVHRPRGEMEAGDIDLILANSRSAKLRGAPKQKDLPKTPQNTETVKRGRGRPKKTAPSAKCGMISQQGTRTPKQQRRGPAVSPESDIQFLAPLTLQSDPFKDFSADLDTNTIRNTYPHLLDPSLDTLQHPGGGDFLSMSLVDPSLAALPAPAIERTKTPPVDIRAASNQVKQRRGTKSRPAARVNPLNIQLNLDCEPSFHPPMGTFSFTGEPFKQVRVPSSKAAKKSNQGPQGKLSGVRIAKPQSGQRKWSLLNPQRAKAKRLTSLADKLLPTLPAQVIDGSDVKMKKYRTRKAETSKFLGKDGEWRAFVACIIVRTITGGLEQVIDWALVARILDLESHRAFIVKRWSWIRNKFKPITSRVQSVFQEAFARAYENGEMSSIDFNSPESFDWKKLHTWTLEQLDNPSKIQPELPGSKKDLEMEFETKAQFRNDKSELYELRGTTAILKRRSIIHSRPLVSLVQPDIVVHSPSDRLDVAKNWVRANIITPESSYSPESARKKFLSIGDDTVHEALQQLLVSRVISQENRRRALPSRTFTISEHFHSRLKLCVKPHDFWQAAKYKQQLYEEFRRDGKSTSGLYGSNGDALAVINLIAAGKVKAHPQSIPCAKPRPTENGYRTRAIDREQLDISVELWPTEMFMESNKLPSPPHPPSSLPQPPQDSTPEFNTSEAKIPIWIGIHGQLISEMWTIVKASLISVLSVQPGITAREISTWLRPSLEEFEIRMMMEWMVEAGVASWVDSTYSGVKLEEWWWMALGDANGKDLTAKGTVSI